jgi:hypothetical protein
MKVYVIPALASLLLAGCATSSHLNRVSVGMTKQQVVEAMGEPQSTRATQGTEYLIYHLKESSTLGKAWESLLDGGSVPGYGESDYYVRVYNGRVDAYGKVGDFDSTHLPESKITVDLNTQNNKPSKPTPSEQAYHRFFVLAVCSNCVAKEVERQIAAGLNADQVTAVCPVELPDYPDETDLNSICRWFYAKGFDGLITVTQPEGDDWKGRIALTLVDTAKHSTVKIYPAENTLRNLNSVSHVGWLLGEQLRQDGYFVTP